jgi:hypothetical protein
MLMVVRLGTETTKYTAVGTCPITPPPYQNESRMLSKRLLARLLLWGTVRA